MKKVYETPLGIFSLDDSNKMARQFERGEYHQQEDIAFIKQLVTEKSVVVDVGAHIGTFSIPLAKHVAKVIAFEPFPDSAALLRENVALNHLENLEVHEVALSDHDGTAGMTTGDVSNTGGIYLIEGDSVKVGMLDTYVPAADFIKIDVEGVEPQVLRGASRLLDTSHPIIFFEMNIPQLRTHNRAPFTELYSLLTKKGYHLYLPTSAGLCPLNSLWFVSLVLQPRSFLLRGNGGVFDLLAIHGTPTLPVRSDGLQYLLKKLFVKALRRA